MSVIQNTRVGSTLAHALGQAVKAMLPGQTERLYSMKVISPRGFFRGTRVHGEGETIEVDEIAARQLFADRIAVAVDPTEFSPLLSTPVVPAPKEPNFGALVPRLEVKVRRDGVALWMGRVYAKGETVSVPEPIAVRWVHSGIGELAKGAGFSSRGEGYLAMLKKGWYGHQY